MSMAAMFSAQLVLEVAKKVGATVIRGVLEKALGQKAGGIAGDMAGEIIDVIASKAGVPAERLPDLPGPMLEEAVSMTEPLASELVLAQVEQQREANRLMLAEMEKDGGTWTWAWRPATMWLIGALWIWSLVLVPVVNAATGAAIPIFLTDLILLTTTFMGLYMGGHTAKEIYQARRRPHD